MKKILKRSVPVLVMVCAISCANSKICDNISRGIYENANQTEEIRDDRRVPPPPEKQTPSYEQYQRERQEALKQQP